MQKTTTPNLSPQDMAAIQRCHDDFSRSMVTKDLETASRTYDDNAVLMPPNHPAVRGRNAIKEWMAGFPPVSQFKIEIEESDARADLAYVRGAFSMVFQPEGAPDPIEEIGKYLEIRKRQPDGSWLLIADIFNSDK
jgi:ketosteroid isomerase-like protein